MNNETFGISAEIALAEAFGVDVSEGYVMRGERVLIDNLKPLLYETVAGIATPIQHTAECGNPVDFVCEDGYTLSLKTNLNALGKACPQIIGQATNDTWYNEFSDFIDDDDDREHYFELSYDEQREIFKNAVFSHISEMLSIYWEHLFECDYLLIAYELSPDGSDAEALLLGRYAPPVWHDEDFSFTREPSDWNESTTVKWRGTSIGEFQAHLNRQCFKFRFNMANLVDLINSGAFEF